MNIYLRGGTTMVRDLVARHLGSREHQVHPHTPPPESERSHTVLVEFDVDPNTLDSSQDSTESYLSRVAIINRLTIDGYATALAAGYAPVHAELTADIIIDAIENAANDEVVLPKEVARRLAVAALEQGPIETEDVQLDRFDTVLLEALIKGNSTREIVEALNYSERTVRRRIQSLCCKVGARDRHDLIRIAVKQSLI